MFSHLRLTRPIAAQGWRSGFPCFQCGANAWTLVETRAVHVMKDSWPKHKAPSDPERPASAAHIVRAMEANKTQGPKLEQAQQKSSSFSSSSSRQSTHAVEHPYTLPAAAPGLAAKGVTPQLPPMPAVPNAPGPKGAAGVMMGGSEQPPGWEEFTGYGRSPTGKARGRRKKQMEEVDGPRFEVYGMRVTAVLVVAIICMELREYSHGPTGWERKVRPNIRTD
mmetsp:Transcript_36832/g.84869  ORF Transcript_36832/g.84869 Transcript_36832/m.84869 type:complete len:222 (+) Transcript_36832:110-775(+)